MKVSELTGPLLAYWVAKALDYQDVRIGGGVVRYSIGTISYDFYLSWEVCGPIIEKMKAKLEFVPTVGWRCALEFIDEPQWEITGASTALVATLRCFVASKYGEEVPDDKMVEAL